MSALISPSLIKPDLSGFKCKMKISKIVVEIKGIVDEIL